MHGKRKNKNTKKITSALLIGGAATSGFLGQAANNVGAIDFSGFKNSISNFFKKLSGKDQNTSEKLKKLITTNSKGQISMGNNSAFDGRKLSKGSKGKSASTVQGHDRHKEDPSSMVKFQGVGKTNSQHSNKPSSVINTQTMDQGNGQNSIGRTSNTGLNMPGQISDVKNEEQVKNYRNKVVTDMLKTQESAEDGEKILNIDLSKVQRGKRILYVRELLEEVSANNSQLNGFWYLDYQVVPILDDSNNVVLKFCSLNEFLDDHRKLLSSTDNSIKEKIRSYDVWGYGLTQDRGFYMLLCASNVLQFAFDSRDKDNIRTGMEKIEKILKENSKDITKENKDYMKNMMLAIENYKEELKAVVKDFDNDSITVRSAINSRDTAKNMLSKVVARLNNNKYKNEDSKNADYYLALLILTLQAEIDSMNANHVKDKTNLLKRLEKGSGVY